MTEIRARLGRILRAVRAQLDMTLAEVSSRTGLAISTLSKVERGKLSLTYDNLVRLCEGLHIDFSAFVEAEHYAGDGTSPTVRARRTITRHGDGTQVETRNYGYLYLCTDLSRKAMIPSIVTIRARSLVQFDSLSSHRGEEFIYVLRGKVEVHTEFYTPVALRRGDALYIDSTMGHATLNVGKRDALVLSVCTSPRSGHQQNLSAKIFPIEGQSHRDRSNGRTEREARFHRTTLPAAKRAVLPADNAGPASGNSDVEDRA
jgi:transcriptional regulator with XRE-family HTH domain